MSSRSMFMPINCFIVFAIYLDPSDMLEKDGPSTNVGEDLLKCLLRLL